MGSSAISQAAAVSALIRRETKIIPRPSGSSNRIEFGVIVRRGISVAAGASITVGHSEWTDDELKDVADRIGRALTYAGYYYSRTDSVMDRVVSFRTVYKVEHKYTALQRANLADVRAYAREHYGENGWDEVEEAWTDDELVEEIGRCRTSAGAIKRIGKIVKLRADHAAEIRATAF